MAAKLGLYYQIERIHSKQNVLRRVKDVSD